MSAPAVAPSQARSILVLVLRGLRDNRRAPLLWGGSLGALSALVVAIWPSIEGSIGQLTEAYPEGLKEAFGIGELDSVEAYIDAEMLSLIVPLALGVFAVRSIVGATVAREERGHLDTLLALPVSRWALAVAAFVVSAVTAAAVLAVVWVLTVVVGLVAGVRLDEAVLARGVANVWPLAVFFAGVAVLAVGLLRSPGVVTGIASGTLVAMYVLDLVGRLSGDLEWLRWLSAFRWYGSAVQDGVVVAHVLGLVAAGTALAAAGAWLFERRDVA